VRFNEFHLSEVPYRQNLATQASLTTVLQKDGLGPVSVKEESYRAVAADSSRFHVGFKVFLRRAYDPVLLTPAQVMALHPRPEFISCQEP